MSAVAQTAPPNSQTPNPPAQNPLPWTLSTATNQAITANPAATAARFQLLQAEMRRLQALAQRHYPISFSSSFGGSNARVIQGPPDNESFYQFINTITIDLLVGRKPRLTVAQSEAQLAAARAQFDAARLALAGQVSGAYYDLLRKRALRKIAQESLDSANRQLTETQKRFKAGDVPELDTLRAQVPVSTAQASLEQAENAVNVSEQTFNNLLGRSLDGPVDITDIESSPNDASLSLTIEEVRAQAVKNSPEVRAAQQSMQAAELAVRISRTARDPVYSLQATDTRGNDVTSFSRLDAIMATVTIPLSDGGLAKAQTKEAEAARAQTQAQLKTAEQTVILNAGTAYRNAKSSIRQIDAARTAQEIAQVSYDKTSRGYQSGLFPLSDVLNAQSALIQARIAYTQAIYDAAAAVAALNNALGVLPR